MAAVRCEVVGRLVAILDRIAPLKQAAKWDNVGLLIDAVQRPAREPFDKFNVMFCNDLTPAVLEEAVAANTSMIVTYHPTPFVAQKQFQLTSVPSSIILTCARHNIAVFSPHTSWDVAPLGLNEWLVRGIAAAADQTLAALAPVKKADDPAAAAAGFGDGRIGELAAAVTVADVAEAVKRHLGLNRVQLALPTAMQPAIAAARKAEGEAGMMRLARTLPATSIAVCAGSGAGVLPGCKASVYVTGEMGHHEVLAACHAGVCVILTGHSNCERGFLSVAAERLQVAVAEDTAIPITPNGSDKPALPPITTFVSTVDCDPLYTV